MKRMISAVAACALAGAASASVFAWNNNGAGANTDAGTPSAIHSEFNTATDSFSWTVTFSDGVAKDTDGLWLVVSPGPNPKGHAFEFAIIYLDASNILDPRATVYRYNGQNADNSFTNPGEFFGSSKIAGPSNITASALQVGGARTLNVVLDATAINNAYGAPGQPDWRGIQFGSKIGVWMHPVSHLNAAYDVNQHLTGWSYGTQGWLDLENSSTPAPGALALAAVGSVVGLRRRRA